MNQRKDWLDEVEIIDGKPLKPNIIVKTTVSRDGVVKETYQGKCGRAKITLKRPAQPPKRAATKRSMAPLVDEEYIQDVINETKRLKDKRDQEAKKQITTTFWEIWPYAMGSLALLCFIGFNGAPPIAVILALTLGMLAWKGKVVADYFDSLEAKAKAKKEAKLAAKVAAAAQKKIEEAQLEAKKQHGEDSSLYCTHSGPEDKTVA